MHNGAFQSTLPVRGATHGPAASRRCRIISIHAPREGSDIETGYVAFLPSISIHAPREGSDADKHYMTLNITISIHAPREGSDSL